MALILEVVMEASCYGFWLAPLFVMFVVGSLILVVLLPLAIFGGAKFRSKSDIDRGSILGLSALSLVAWIVLIFFCNYFDLSLLWSIIATIGTFVLFIVIVGLAGLSVISLYEKLKPKKS
jgi:hypothetical protein